MNSRTFPRIALLLLPLWLPLLLVACGDLPEPFLGNPGAMGRRLATPPIAALAVPTPARTAAMADPRANGDFADLLAVSLEKEEIPTFAREPQKGDWSLAITAERKGDQVIPRYGIRDPAGREQGAVDGTALPASAWATGTPKVLGQAARDAVPRIVALMMSIRATRDRADPNSLLNRVAKLYVPEVTGAPGDGNFTLTKLIRARLPEFGPLVQLTPENTDFHVRGEVVATPLPKGKQQIEITWTVTRPSGVVVGKVSQLNSVAAGSLDRYWGDVAVVVAQEAASGIDRVVQRFIGRDPNQPGGGSPTAKPASGAATVSSRENDAAGAPAAIKAAAPGAPAIATIPWEEPKAHKPAIRRNRPATQVGTPPPPAE